MAGPGVAEIKIKKKKKKSNCALGCDEKSNQIFGEGAGPEGDAWGELIPTFSERGRGGSWREESAM